MTGTGPITVDELIDFHFANQALKTWEELLLQFEQIDRTELKREFMSSLTDDLEDFIFTLVSNNFSLIGYSNGKLLHSKWMFGPVLVTILKDGTYVVADVENFQRHTAMLSDKTALFSVLDNLF